MAVLWKHVGQRQAGLRGAVFCCVVLNYGQACVTLPTATLTFHPQLTLQNTHYTHTALQLAWFQLCHAAYCCAGPNQGLLSPECVFIVDYSWPASECVALTDSVFNQFTLSSLIP